MRIQQTLLATASLASALLIFSPTVLGHGGTYLGPGDTVPPGGSGGGGGGAAPSSPGAGSPASPSAPTPGAPSPGAPGTPGGGPQVSGTPTTPSGGASPDLTAWSFWWEFNKSNYLGLRDALEKGGVQTGSAGWYLGLGEGEQAVDIQRPTQAQIRDLVVPALLRTLASETNNDVVTGAMMALAKIGDTPNEDGSSPFSKVLIPFLRDSQLEISETAALALGILGHESNVDLLKSLAADSPDGRKALGQTEVPRRTRTFAVYALGLVGGHTAEDSVKADILDELRAQLLDEATATRDIAVACTISMGLFTPEAVGLEFVDNASPSLTTSHAQIGFLMDLFQDSKTNPFVRAHAATSMVRVLELQTPELRDAWKDELAGALIAVIKDRTQENEVIESAVLALGALGDADSDEVDQQIRRTLVAVPKLTQDQQARNFSLISLAQLAKRPGADDAGLDQIHDALLARLSGSKNALRSWSALSIGVFARAAGERFPDDLAEAIAFELAEQRGPKIAPYAIAAGLIGDESMTGTLLAKLEKVSDDTARGYISLALGMLGDHKAIEPVQELVSQSTYRAELLRQAAIGLGLMGDQAAVTELLDALDRSDSLATKAAVTDALGFIGDRRSIEPLIKMLEEPDGIALARGFAAAALGNICDPNKLPWNSPISRDINYRAATETLTGLGGRGILDIL